MDVVLEIPKVVHRDLLGHLLTTGSGDEEAAFLFTRAQEDARATTLSLVDWSRVERAGFAYQSAGYLELVDEMRPRIIKKAHDLGTSIVEVHSHPYPWPAAFSQTDLLGLREFVPHVRWRLKGQPYVAIVVAPSGFDALVWSRYSTRPLPLRGIIADGELMTPTGITLARILGDQGDE